MVEYMKVNLEMIEDMVKAHIFIQTDASILENGIKVNSLEKVNILKKMEKKLMVNGTTVKLKILKIFPN